MLERYWVDQRRLRLCNYDWTANFFLQYCHEIPLNYKSIIFRFSLPPTSNRPLLLAGGKTMTTNNWESHKNHILSNFYMPFVSILPSVKSNVDSTPIIQEIIQNTWLKIRLRFFINQIGPYWMIPKHWKRWEKWKTTITYDANLIALTTHLNFRPKIDVME